MGKIIFNPSKDYSVFELKQLAQQQGWSIESKGKTGHMIRRKDGCVPFDIPTHPSKKTKQKIIKLLGLK